MAKNYKKITVRPEDAGKRLDHFLAEQAAVSRGEARRLILAGSVYLNRHRVRMASKALIVGAQIEVYLRDSVGVAADRVQEQVARAPLSVLFEDDAVLVIDKPPGLPTQPTLDQSRWTAYAAAQEYLKKQAESLGKDPTKTYCGLHHRLDRDTSGALLFTVARIANAGVARAFQEHRVKKIYWALVAKSGSRPLPPQFEVENYLAAKKLPGKKTQVQSVHSGGDLAQTAFEVIEEFKGGYLVEACPKTGRMHQIRVHLAEMGYPILGDRSYGGRLDWAGSPIPRCLLHARSLKLPHPTLAREISVQSPLPRDFESCIARLRSETTSGSTRS